MSESEDLESINIVEDNLLANIENDISEPNSPNILTIESDLAVTVAQAIEILESAWLNEKFSPELLPHKFDIIEEVLEQISNMEANMEIFESNNFQKCLHQMEIDRLRFMVTSYLRNRLEKLETYTISILNAETERAQKNESTYLTPEELQFAKDFNSALESHFGKVLDFWRTEVSKSDWKNQPVTPNMYSFIFLKSKADIPGVVLDDGRNEESDVVDFKNGSQVLISYHTVSNLVKDGKVQLI